MIELSLQLDLEPSCYIFFIQKLQARLTSDGDTLYATLATDLVLSRAK
jgi:hypothetical protein